MSQFRQITTVWLTAVFLCMSLVSAAHSVEHIGEDEQTHLDCSLCSHKYQNKIILETAVVSFVIDTQHYQPHNFLLPVNFFQYKSIFQSRAPPENC